MKKKVTHNDLQVVAVLVILWEWLMNILALSGSLRTVSINSAFLRAVAYHA